MEIKNNYFKEDVFKISPFEKDLNKSVKISALLNDMQLVAAKSIDTIDHKFSITGLAEKGLGWFLIRYKILFDDYPTNVEELKIQTECRGCNKMTTYRDFEVYDNLTSKRVLKASSTWFIVDLKSKSVVNINKEFPEFLNFEKRENDITFQKLKAPEEYTNKKIFEVRFDDLDMNGHVNNTVYATWAMETINYDFRISHRLKSLDIYFKHEVKYGDKILSLAKNNAKELIIEHVLKNEKTSEEVCIIKSEFECL